jgi:hypothetical protein
MRLLISFLVVVATIVYIGSLRPDCSMSDMNGVEWLECLAR